MGSSLAKPHRASFCTAVVVMVTSYKRGVRLKSVQKQNSSQACSPSGEAKPVSIMVSPFVFVILELKIQHPFLSLDVLFRCFSSLSLVALTVSF